MALESPMDLVGFHNAVKRWFNHATGLTTIWAGQHAAQPPYPFASLKLISGPVQYGQDDERHTTDLEQAQGEEIAVEVCGPRDVTVSCQVLTASDSPGSNAHHYLAIAQASLGLPSVFEAMRAENVVIVDAQPPQDLDFIASGAIKSRAAMDVRFRLQSSLVERTGYIQTIGVEGTYKDPDGSTASVVEDTYGA